MSRLNRVPARTTKSRFAASFSLLTVLVLQVSTPASFAGGSSGTHSTIGGILPEEMLLVTRDFGWKDLDALSQVAELNSLFRNNRFEGLAKRYALHSIWTRGFRSYDEVLRLTRLRTFYPFEEVKLVFTDPEDCRLFFEDPEMPKQVQNLALEGACLDAQSLLRLKTFTNLKSLQIKLKHEFKQDAEFAEALRSLAALQHLSIDKDFTIHSATSKSLDALRELRNLKSLNLLGVDKPFRVRLNPESQVSRLKVTGGLCNEVLDFLKGNADALAIEELSLVFVELAGSCPSDLGEHLAGLQKLESLAIHFWRVENEGKSLLFDHLAKIHRLRGFQLDSDSRHGHTAAGVIKIIEANPRLESLSLRGVIRDLSSFDLLSDAISKLPLRELTLLGDAEIREPREPIPVERIFGMLQSAPLEQLSIGGLLPLVASEGLQTLPTQKSLRQFKWITNQASPRSVALVLNALGPDLETLELSTWGTALTAENLSLLANFRSLRSLIIWDQLPWSDLRESRFSLPQLAHLSMTGKEFHYFDLSQYFPNLVSLKLEEGGNFDDAESILHSLPRTLQTLEGYFSEPIFDVRGEWGVREPIKDRKALQLREKLNQRGLLLEDVTFSTHKVRGFW